MRWSHLIVFILNIPSLFIRESSVHDLIEPATTGFFAKNRDVNQKKEENLSKQEENKKLHKKENLAYFSIFCEVATIFVY